MGGNSTPALRQQCLPRLVWGFS